MLEFPRHKHLDSFIPADQNNRQRNADMLMVNGQYMPFMGILDVIKNEIARIEIPQWVAQDETQLNLTHTLVLDQCQRGQGYPVVLGEAHEKAVITGADRENFWQMVDVSLIAEHLPTLGSAKSRSKKTRWV